MICKEAFEDVRWWGSGAGVVVEVQWCRCSGGDTVVQVQWCRCSGATAVVQVRSCSRGDAGAVEQEKWCKCIGAGINHTLTPTHNFYLENLDKKK